MSQEFRLHYRLLAIACGLTSLISSCSADTGGGQPGQSGDVPIAAPSQGVAAESDTVRVILDEYTVGIPSRLPAGPTVLRLESVGFEEHNLLFVLTETDSLVWKTERRLGPYEKRTVTVDLVPGTYTVVCDFSGHEGRGMFADLIVEAARIEN